MLSAALENGTFKGLRDLIYEKSGIYISDAKKYLLEKKLSQRLEERNLGSFEDYLAFLKYSPNGNELPRLFDAITVNETYFFREPQQLDVFIDSVVPLVAARQQAKEMKIWSAACSTGEEAYTLVMLLLEKRLGGRLDVFATDLSTAVLESARKGVYGSYSTRNVPEPYLKKYFTCNGWSHEIDAAVKSMVKFMNVNLIDEARMRSFRDMDVIFCRNVLIYFDDKAKQRVVSHLYDSLKPDGFLFIGSSESLHNVTRAFKPVVFNKVVAYRKV